MAAMLGALLLLLGGAPFASKVLAPRGAPTIVTEPVAQTGPIGGEASFAVVASGEGPLAYRWRKDGIDLLDGPRVSGATTDALLLSDLGWPDAGGYSVVVTNKAGHATSREAPLTVRAARPGDIDPTFHRIVFPIDALARMPDGKILIGGEPFTTGTEAHSLALLNGDGTVEPFAAQLNDAVRTIALQPDGKILVGGRFTGVSGGDLRSGVARLNPAGDLDPSFQDALLGGAVHTLALQPDGAVLAGGDFARSGFPERLARLSSSGNRDTSFMSGLPGANGAVRALAVQPDGRILVGGEFTKVNGEARKGIARLNADGSLDRTFQDGMGGVEGAVYALVLQPDGGVLIGGTFSSVNGVPWDNLARLDAEGSLDATGPAGANGTVRALVSQPDGKVLLGGDFTRVKGVARNRLARLLSDGSLDPTFPTREPDPGAVRPGGTDDAVHAIVCDPNGGIWIAGRFHRVNGVIRPSIAPLGVEGDLVEGFRNLWLAGMGSSETPLALQPDGNLLIGGPNPLRPLLSRVHPDGTVDASFGAPRSADPASPALTQARRLGLQSDGKTIIVGGNFQLSPKRFLPDGRLDPSFRSLTFLRNPNGSGVHTVALQQDGRVLVGGWFLSVQDTPGGPFHPRAGIARLNPDGSVDPTFLNGMTGVTPSSPRSVLAIALQQDGKMIVGGAYSLVNGIPRNGISRLHVDGSLDTSFQHGMSGVSGTVFAVVVQPDGRVLLGGDFSSVNGALCHGIARLLPDGSLDPTFQAGVAGEFPSVAALALQPDGRVLIGGTFSTVNGAVRHNIARLHADGTLDLDFEADLSPSGSAVTSLVLATEGRIWVGGMFTTVNGSRYPRVARLQGVAPVEPGITSDPPRLRPRR